MTITFIRPQQTLGTDFSPVAEIVVPSETLRNRGVDFVRDQDDLGVYEYLPASVEGRGLLMLQHYLDPSSDVMNLLLADNFRERANLIQTFTDLAEALAIPVSAFRWRQDGQEVPLAAPESLLA